MKAGGKFRSRKLDFKKSLAVYRASDIPDIDQAVSHRGVPVVATGVEKEEEEVK